MSGVRRVWWDAGACACQPQDELPQEELHDADPRAARSCLQESRSNTEWWRGGLAVHGAGVVVGNAMADVLATPPAARDEQLRDLVLERVEQCLSKGEVEQADALLCLLCPETAKVPIMPGLGKYMSSEVAAAVCAVEGPAALLRPIGDNLVDAAAIIARGMGRVWDAGALPLHASTCLQ